MPTSNVMSDDYDDYDDDDDDAKSQMSISIYDSKQKEPALHNSERTIVPRTVIFDF